MSTVERLVDEALAEERADMAEIIEERNRLRDALESVLELAEAALDE